MPEEIRTDSSGPRSFGPYRLLEELGRGAQGVVYLAERAELRRKVALKVLTAAAAQSPASRDRFRREAAIASKLDHPGICGVVEAGEHEGLPFLAMQYLEGVTLAQILEAARDGGEGAGAAGGTSLVDRTGKVVMEDVVRLVERAARALHAAHEAGLVHRDMKPGNVMVTPEGNPVLLDFGLARDLEAQGQTLTESGQIVGTPAYLAPEQIVAERGKVDRRADVYALGVTLYECLTLQRPFEADTWDQLFHKILEGAPASPRKFNPRVPEDLATVVLTAMDRDPARRYATAEAFAEDLRKVRAFEPIEAKAPGPISRAIRWSRARPAAAVGIAAGVLFLLVGAGLLTGQGIARRSAVRGHLARAEQLLAAGGFTEALEAVSQARERDASSPRALELKTRIEAERERAAREERRRADLEAAREAREESRRKQEEYARQLASIASLREALEGERSSSFSAYADEAVRGAFARKERDLEGKEAEAARLLQEAQEALQRAARFEAPWEGPSAETEAAFAEYFLGRWREALASKDVARAAWFRSAVERSDRAGIHRAELLGRGTLAVTVEPPDAEVFLFRYEPYETVRGDDPVPRLVPVPTAGVSRVREGEWAAGFHPGDLALSVLSVEPGSIGERSGLRRGDLILRMNGEPCGDGAFVLEVVPESEFARGGVRPGMRILSIAGVPVRVPYDWKTAPLPAEGERHRGRFSGIEGEVSGIRSDLNPGSAAQLLHEGATVLLRWVALRDGEVSEIVVPAGERSGIRCEVTAYPLVLAAENRVEARRRLEVDPGSYLVFARRGGFEGQRLPVLVGRRREVEARITLLEDGTTPPGFVFVPPGPFIYGGDPRVFQPAPAEIVESPGFFLARRELTNQEWFEFVNDEETLAIIEAASERKILPREPGSLIARRRTEGRGYDWGPSLADTPVLGISWNDAQEFLRWKNRKASEAGERWIYDLPTQKEWEKAARGADGRPFPWGERFDFSLTLGAYRKKGYLLDAPVGFEPRDESPYGLLDMGGSRQEWTKDLSSAPADAQAIYHIRGGAWGQAGESTFRSAGRGYAIADATTGYTGLRLVARPR